MVRRVFVFALAFFCLYVQVSPDVEDDLDVETINGIECNLGVFPSPSILAERRQIRRSQRRIPMRSNVIRRFIGRLTSGFVRSIMIAAPCFLIALHLDDSPPTCQLQMSDLQLRT